MPFQDPLAVCEGRYQVPPTVSSDCAALIRNMLTLDRHVRVTSLQIMSSPWPNKDESVPLKPCGRGMGDVERPTESTADLEVSELMRDIGYADEDIAQALTGQAYSTVTATYLLYRHRKVKSPEKHQSELRAIRAKCKGKNIASTSPQSPKKHVGEGAVSRARAGSAGSRPVSVSLGDMIESPRTPGRSRRNSMFFFLVGGNGDGKEKDKEKENPVLTPTDSPAPTRSRRNNHMQSPLAVATEEGESDVPEQPETPSTEELETSTSKPITPRKVAQNLGVEDGPKRRPVSVAGTLGSLRTRIRGLSLSRAPASIGTEMPTSESDGELVEDGTVSGQQRVFAEKKGIDVDDNDGARAPAGKRSLFNMLSHGNRVGSRSRNASVSSSTPPPVPAME